MAEKPTAAFVLSLIGGIFILLVAIVVMALASVIGSLMLIGGGDPNLAYLYGAVGLIFAILVLVGAVMLWMKPQQHVMWGVVVLLFSLFSIITTGGFFIGLILGLIGGILGVAWKPPAPMAPGMAPPMMPPSMPPPRKGSGRFGERRRGGTPSVLFQTGRLAASSAA